MTTLAATATTDTIHIALILTALAVVTLGYGLLCWLYPFGHCRRCHGTGRRPSPLGKHFRLCRRCDGTGRTIRPGRHVLNYLRDKGTR
ncbi:hypothetical protein O7632_31120 [Solwaraspora sp. WMMD406]|uniref:hypothetical protein n=1 Tax=Solwaraspora sp. WMMD406 TaxID=3016095 RepID=UPI0024166CAC|nr:hypothetical protein [Solwaraspora sp. WMMD406]MDG4768512.1 hypothetical protein [Solwaraspora sp. WMMD406]